MADLTSLLAHPLGMLVQVPAEGRTILFVHDPDFGVVSDVTVLSMDGAVTVVDRHRAMLDGVHGVELPQPRQPILSGCDRAAFCLDQSGRPESLSHYDYPSRLNLETQTGRIVVRLHYPMIPEEKTYRLHNGLVQIDVGKDSDRVFQIAVPTGGDSSRVVEDVHNGLCKLHDKGNRADVSRRRAHLEAISSLAPYMMSRVAKLETGHVET